MINSHPLAPAKKKQTLLEDSYSRKSAKISKQTKATSRSVDLANGYSQGPNGSLVEKPDPTQQTFKSEDVGKVSCETTTRSQQDVEQEREYTLEQERPRLKLRLKRLFVRLRSCFKKISRHGKLGINPQPSASKSVAKKELKLQQQATIVDESLLRADLEKQKPVRSKSAVANHESRPGVSSTDCLSEDQEEALEVLANRKGATQRKVVAEPVKAITTAAPEAFQTGQASSSECQGTGTHTTRTTSAPSWSDMDATSTNEASQSGEPDFKTVFGMVIHLKDEKIARRQAILDTGATPNVISHRVVRELGLEMGQYKGGKIAPIGEMFLPIGTITFEWHVVERIVTYRTCFGVLEDKYSKDFDILLGKDTIAEIGFYRVNNNIFLGAYAGENRLAPPLSIQ